MRKSYFLFYALVLLCIVACGQAKETVFDKNGVSFVYPAGWTVSDMEDEEIFYIYVYENRPVHGGMTAVAILDEEIAAEEFFAGFEPDFFESSGYKIHKDGELKDGVYGKYPAGIKEYIVQKDGNKFNLRLVVFIAGGKTFCITENSLSSAYDNVKKVHRQIENTFNQVR